MREPTFGESLVHTVCTDCTDEQQRATIARAVSELASNTNGDYEHESCTIATLDDGRILVLEEWADCSGHG